MDPASDMANRSGNLRSDDPDATAGFYETHFGATRISRVENGDQLRVTIDIVGLPLFIDRDASGPPHLGKLRIRNHNRLESGYWARRPRRR